MFINMQDAVNSVVGRADQTLVLSCYILVGAIIQGMVLGFRTVTDG